MTGEGWRRNVGSIRPEAALVSPKAGAAGLARIALRGQVKSCALVHIPRKLSRRCGLVAGATALCFALAASGLRAQSQSSDEPQYAPGGDLLLPNGFDTWVFVGSNLCLSYLGGAGKVTTTPCSSGAPQRNRGAARTRFQLAVRTAH